MSAAHGSLAEGMEFASEPYLLDESAAHAYQAGVKEPPRRRRRNIHTDREAASRAGFEAPIAAGEHTIAVMMQLLVDQFGMNFIRGGGFEVTLIKPVLYGDTICCHASVIGIKEGRAEFRVWVENQRGQHVLTGTASARVE